MDFFDNQTHNDLIDWAQAVGDLTECNAHYTAMLARKIEATGKKVEDLKLGEFLKLVKEASERFREIHDQI